MHRRTTFIQQHPLRAKLLVAVCGFLLSCAVILALAAGPILFDAGGGLAVGASGPPDAAAGHSARSVMAAAAILALLSAISAVRLGRRIFFGLEEMQRAAGLMASGQREVPLSVSGTDEIGRLARALQEMAASTNASYHAVEEQNRNLERIVRLSTEELRHKNLALAFQNEKVNEANKLKSAFLASVSHELRTPLNAILALSEMLRDQISGPLSEEQVKQAAMIYNSGENLLHLINQVLDLSKIESGRMEVKRENVAIVDVLTAVGRSLKPLAEEKGLVFEVSAEGSGIEACVDAEKLRQVFVNLLGNAIKFTERGSVKAQVKLLEEENLLFVEVRDTGPGIGPEYHHQIFQEFYQLERAGPGSKGTGLGLAISRKLVNLLGGDIWVDSDLDQGARFAFVVPMAGADEESETRRLRGPVSEREENGSHQRVLIVDDDVVEAGVLSRYLRQQGLGVVTALDGLEAINIMRREPLDLVVLDLFNRGDDAFELLKRMGSHPRLKSVPVVVNSARQLDAEEVFFLKPRVQSIFVKGSRGVGHLIGEITEALHRNVQVGHASARDAGVPDLEDAA